jgi:thioredoxin-like negative regulator of GroEL
MKSKEAEELFSKGLQALEHDHLYLARTCFEQALELEKTPRICSFLALCRAKTQAEFGDAVRMAEDAVASSPEDPDLYLNLSKIYLLAGDKTSALAALRNGISHDKNGLIQARLEMHGTRKSPLFPSLKRNHPLNKYLGLLLSRLKLR